MKAVRKEILPNRLRDKRAHCYEKEVEEICRDMCVSV